MDGFGVGVGVKMGKNITQPAVYIMASQRNGTLYTGVTGRLAVRVGEHRAGKGGGFAAKYGCTILVWYEVCPTMEVAIAREKQIKGGSRAKKLRLIETANSGWRDLFFEIV
jgi:predicted GIY-YIG superfamily endonuclease